MIMLLPWTLCQSALFPVLRKSIMSQVAVKENGKDGEGQKERARRSGWNWKERERERVVVRSWQGCQMSTLGLCQVVIEFFRSPVNLESLFPFKTRSMERKRRRMELRASPGKILPLWWYRWFPHLRVVLVLVRFTVLLCFIWHIQLCS